MEAWKKFLDDTTVEDVLDPDFHLIFSYKTDKILDTLKLLKEKNISSVPVYDQEKKRFVGIVDVFDLLVVLIFMNDLKSLFQMMNHKEVDWYSFIESEMALLKNESIESIINSSQRNPWCPVSRLAPLHSLMDMLSKDVDLHRVPVVDDDGKVISLITQSKIINFLYQNIDRYPDTAAIKIKDSFVPTEVVSVPPDCKAIEGYQLMLKAKVSGIAIVGEDETLIGSLSGSDLKKTTENNLIHDLHLPILSYIQGSSPEFEKPLVHFPVSCTLDMNLYEVLHKLVAKRIHRLFIIDSQQKPIGVLSLCDIITMMNLNKTAVSLSPHPTIH